MEWREKLAELTGRRPCVLGVGNRWRGDDAAGPVLCDRLAGRFGGAVIDAGIAPENHLEVVIGQAARVIIVVDAADFGGAPGEVRLLCADELSEAGLSTHACSPRMLSDYLIARSADPPTIRWLVIQPRSTEGDRLSTTVARGLDHVAKGLCELWPTKPPT